MLAETLEAPEAVARMLAANAPAVAELAARLRARPPPFAVTCARGSSDNAATYLKYLLEINLGVAVASVGPSVSSVYRARPRVKDALFVAISQSGRSPDLLDLAAVAREEGAVTVALVNDAASPLAERCEIVLPLQAGPERSVAATKSFIASLAAGLQVGAAWSGDAALGRALAALPDDLARAAAADWSGGREPIAGARDLYVIGRGIGFGIAQEGALKLKETSLLHAEALSAAEVMHGPLALTSPDFPVVVFSQPDGSLPGMVELISALRARAVPVIAAGPAAGAGAVALPVADGLDPFAAPIALIQSFYPLAEAIARARGLDPDHPPHLRKVTQTL
jgi:glucosamine--fructose-6-phosphate aminotransferase (isomerizing)